MAKPRKPISILKATGSYRPCRHGSRQDEMSLSCGSIGEPPDFLAANPAALKEWNRLVLDPVYRAVLAPIFLPLVAEYCMETAALMANPNEMSTAERRHRLRLASELLLTPASRAAHPLPEPASAGKNEFDVLD